MKQIYLGTSQTLHINPIFRGVINPGDIIDIPDDLYETEFKNHKKYVDLMGLLYKLIEKMIYRSRKTYILEQQVFFLFLEHM